MTCVIRFLFGFVHPTVLEENCWGLDGGRLDDLNGIWSVKTLSHKSKGLLSSDLVKSNSK